jgi:hypothetical protein
MVARKALTAALALLPILVAGATTYLVYRQPRAAYVDFERRYEEGFISGFHTHERMEGRGFRWSTGDSRIRLENLPPQTRLRVEVRVKALRPKEVPLPHIRFTANGATVFETMCAPGLVTYRFGVTLRDDSLELGIHPDIFVPAHYGREDDRVLGVQVFSVSVEPQGGAPEWRAAARRMMMAAALLLAAGLLAGLSLTVSSLTASLLIAGFAYLLGQDSVLFSPYPQRILTLAGMMLLASGVLRVVLSRVRWLTPTERSILIAVLAGSLLLKVAGLFYPLFFSSDADFHVNRLLELMEGNFFTTSVTQHHPPFRIPYPVSLYVLAAPLSAIGLSSIAVLKLATALADITVSLILAFLGARFLKDVRAGILAAALYQLVPLNFLAFSSGNFTNLFGAATIVIFLALLLTAAKGKSSLPVAGALVASLLALTAHFGSFLYGALLWPAWLVAICWIAPGELGARQRNRILGAAAASFSIACIYYLGYWELFTSQWERVLSRDYATGDAVLEGPLAKLAFNWSFFKEQVGILFAVLALLGAVPILRRPRSSPFHAAAAAWLGVSGVFFLLDLTTALEVRYVLQVLPLLALFAGSFLSGAFRRKMSGRLAGGLALVYLTVAGLRNYAYCLLERYH